MIEHDSGGTLARVGMLILEATGSDGERLAMAAGERTGIAVGWDSEFNSATFDSDLGDEELQTTVFSALDELDTDWRSQLQVVD